MNISDQTSKSYLFKLSIPIFFSNLAIPFAGLVDTGLMGHLNSENFLAAISIATSVITMIFWSFGFLRMGTVGLVAQASGPSDMPSEHLQPYLYHHHFCNTTQNK